MRSSTALHLKLPLARTDTRYTMRRRTLLVAATLLLTFGCSSRLSDAPPVDRSAVLAGCVRAVHPVPRPLRALTRLGRVEACMAERRLPGHAWYESGGRRVFFAYQADQPVLHF